MILALAVPWLAGCSYFGFPYPGDFEDYPEPSIIATYETGTATITLEDGTLIELDQVARHSTLDTMSGTSVRWTGGDGWHLTLGGAGGDDEIYGSFAYLQFDRIVDTEHWTIFDSDRCIVDVERVDKTVVEGTATCRGLEWFDALEQPMMSEPSPLDEPKFDAEITFEARP